MPELPEVETVVRGLRETLPGRRILAARLGKTDFIDDPGAIEQHVPGKRIEAVRRVGKFLVFDLHAGAANPAERHHLIVHLGMTGQLITMPREAPAAAHTHVYFELDDGRDLRYIDPRRFGRMALVSADGHHEVLGHLGAEPLEISEDEFRAKLAGRRARIKALLLDQSVLRGMGNIYSDECLWWARIHPSRLAASLDRDAVHRLHKAVRKVLNEAIAKRGSSISNYPRFRRKSGRVSGAPSRVSAAREEVLPLRHADPPHHGGRPQHPFLSAVPVRAPFAHPQARCYT
jgi:formamidopyrimidine-DNA glycosylase